jgi:ATP-dependent Clp protease ATP-binding subunit ClpA
MSLFRRKVFSRYTASAKQLIFYARYEALTRHADTITPVHLLLGLARKRHAEDCPFRFVHERREELAQAVGLSWLDAPSSWSECIGNIPLAPESKRILAYAVLEARSTKSFWIDTDHLQAAILREGGEAANALQSIGYTLPSTRDAGVDARRRYPPKAPTVRQRFAQYSLSTWIFAGAIVGFLLNGLFEVLRSR